MASLIRVDLHTHTWRSPDSRMQGETISHACKARNISVIAITDHNRIESALELAESMPVRVIVGEEVRTTEGEIIGLFIERKVPRGLSPEETVTAIHEQDGLAYVPHPFDLYRRSRLRPETLERIANTIDVLEVFNSRNTLKQHNQQAVDFALAHGIAQGAGSDAHVGYEVGRAYVEMPDFHDRESFLAALRQGQVHGQLSFPGVHVVSKIVAVSKTIGGRRH